MAEEKNGETPEKQEIAFTPVEERAQEQGWVPQDKWEGDPDQWRPAKEFLDRGELFKKIDEQNRTIKEFKKTLDDMAKHHSKVKETEYKRALEDLKLKKKEALVEGDADAVVDIDERMALVRDAQKEATVVQQPQASQENNIIFSAWVNKNGWYNTNKAMRAYADRVGGELGTAGGLSPTDLLAKVEQEVKKEFKERFNNPNRDKPGSVEGSTNKGDKSKDTFSLSEEQRRVMNRFVKAGVMTEEAYIAEAKRMEGSK